MTRRSRSIRAAALVMLGAAPIANAEILFGVTESQTLVSFDSAAPGNLLSGVAISGLDVNERVRGIDFRPATGELFLLGSFSNLYTVDTSSGAVSLVGAGAFSPGLNGSSFGFDFNPTIDRIRVVSEVNQNLVLNPDSGTSTQATDLFYDAGDPNEGRDPNVVGSAYTNSFRGSVQTQLFGLDTGLDILVRQANNTGVLTTVGPLGVDVSDSVGFEISGVTAIAYTVVQDRDLGQSTLWRVDLDTGSASMIGAIGGGSMVGSISAVPAPGTLGCLAIGLVASGRGRRRS